MKPRKDPIQTEELATPDGSAQKITLPYLDWHINPEKLTFNEKDPVNSIHKKNEAILLGEGGFGGVYLYQKEDSTKEPKTYEWIAIKKYKDVSQQSAKDIEHQNKSIEKEIAHLKQVNLFIKSDLENPKEKMIFMKLIPGRELFESMVGEKASPQNLSFLQKMVIAKGIMKKTSDLHHDAEKMKAEMRGKEKEKKIMFHEDIKPDNIIVDYRNMTIRLCDFGISESMIEEPTETIGKNIIKTQQELEIITLLQVTQLTRLTQKELPAELKKLTREELTRLSKEELPAELKEEVKKELLAKLADTKPTLAEFPNRGIVGTIMYMAPEIFLKQSPVNEKTEIYAAGVTLAILFNLHVGATDHSFKGTRYEEFADDRCMLVEESDSAAQKIPYQLYKLISRMMDHDPKNRPTAVEASILLNQIFDKAAGPPKPDEREGNKKGKIKKYPMKVGVISIDDFQKMSEKQKQRSVDKIIDQKINAVVLQGSENTTNKNYYEVCRYLNRQNIISIAPFMTKPDQALSNDKKEKVSCRIAKDHYDQRLATANTQAYFYDSKKRKFEGKKPSLFSMLRTKAYSAFQTMKKKIGVDNEKTADFLKHHESEMKHYANLNAQDNPLYQPPHSKSNSNPLYQPSASSHTTDLQEKADTRKASHSSQEIPNPIVLQEDNTEIIREAEEALACFKKNKEFYYRQCTDKTFRENEKRENPAYSSFVSLYNSMGNNAIEFIDYANKVSSYFDKLEQVSDEEMKKTLVNGPHIREFLIDNANHPAIKNWYERNPKEAKTKKEDAEVEQALDCLNNNKEFYCNLLTDNNFVSNEEKAKNTAFVELHKELSLFTELYPDEYRDFVSAFITEKSNEPGLISLTKGPTSDVPMKNLLAKSANLRDLLIDNANHPAIKNWYERNPKETEKKDDTVEDKHLHP